MMKKRIIPISLPVTGEEEWQALKEPLKTGWLTAGPKVRAFKMPLLNAIRSNMLLL